MKRFKNHPAFFLRSFTILMVILLLPGLGNTQNVGIGTAAPAEKLHVAGNLRLDALAGTATRIVTADLNGSLGVLAAGNAGDVLVETGAGPAWQTMTGWSTLGNAGTVPATNFVGTTDAQGLAFRTNNIERMRITDAGNVCVQGTGPLPSDVFSSYADLGQVAVAGYANNNGRAAHFAAYGTGHTLVAEAWGTSGSAGRFYNGAGTNNPSPVLRAENWGGTAPAISVYSSTSSPTAHGLYVQTLGNSSNRGAVVEMGANTAGAGAAVLGYGSGISLAVQTFSSFNASSGILSDHAGTGKALEAKTFLTTHTAQVGLFHQASTGVLPATYANAAAVWGQSDGIRGGAFLSRGPTASNTVLQGVYGGPGGNYDGIGVIGVFAPAPSYGYGVVGQGNWYGVFANGNLGASGTKPFMIDHPADPANKYLRHFSIESPEVLNLYRGTITLDANGQADVTLPSYFHLINQDFSYQLTAIGGASQAYIAEEITPQGQFKIAGGLPHQKICWVVYADRHDAYVQHNPELIKVEVEKRDSDKGKYLHPEFYGKDETDGVFYRNKITGAQDVAPMEESPNLPAPGEERK